VNKRRKDAGNLRTSLHSVFVSSPYFSALSSLHFLQTIQRKTCLYVWSMSVESHSSHLGFNLGSKDTAVGRDKSVSGRL
jgi:hypothetical protein